ncbi:17834_t:CDS:1, partial [Racocetra fulgida]
IHRNSIQNHIQPYQLYYGSQPYSFEPQQNNYGFQPHLAYDSPHYQVVHYDFQPYLVYNPSSYQLHTQLNQLYNHQIRSNYGFLPNSFESQQNNYYRNSVQNHNQLYNHRIQNNYSSQYYGFVPQQTNNDFQPHDSPHYQ